VNGAGRNGVGGDGNSPRPGWMHAVAVIGSSGDATGAGPRPRRQRMLRAGRRSVRISAFLVCAAAILIVFSMAMAPLGKGSGDRSATLDNRQPLPPHQVQGYIYQADGVTPVGNCVVNITNKNTGAWNLTITDPDYGWYEHNMNFFDGSAADGDIVNVTAEKDGAIGWVEGIVTPAPLNMNVLLTGTVIPEFPLVIAPVLGLMALFAVVNLKRRKDSSE